MSLPKAPQWHYFANAAGIIVLAFLIALGVRQLVSLWHLQDRGARALARELNHDKHRDFAPAATQINPRATLSAVLGSGQDLNRWSMEDGATFEGVVVDVKTPPLESLVGSPVDRGNTHIELALDAAAPPAKRVIVEVTPRWRTRIKSISDWSTAALRNQLIGRRLRVTGWLFDDVAHVNEAENTNPGGARDSRATVWEIHPVTSIELLPGTAVRTADAAPTATQARQARE